MHRSPVRSFWIYLSRLLLAVVLLAGCSQAASTVVSPAESPTQTAAAPTKAQATPTETQGAPTRTTVPPTLAPTASPTPAYPQRGALKPIPAEALAQPETYKSGVLYLERAEGNGFSDFHALMLLKMDQQAIGRITPEGVTTAFYRPAQGTVKMISYGTPAEAAVMKTMGWEAVLAPELCRPPAGWPAQKGDFIPCSDYTFSADGRFLAYKIQGPRQTCGATLKILGLEKRMHVISEKSGLWSIALPSGSILYAVGHCEGGMIMRFDTKSGKNAALAELPAGGLLWNPQQTAFFAMVGDEMGNQVSLWGYNAENNTIFLRVNSYDSSEFDESPTWTPDGKALLFRRLSYQKSGGEMPSFTFAHPSQIVKVDIATRAQSVLDEGLHYNYFLCDSSGAPCSVSQWAGDFFQMRRAKFEPATWTSAEFTFPEYLMGDNQNPEVLCRLKGRECQPPVELVAYNYKTDQIIPWSETGLPDQIMPRPENLPTGPAADAKPVYEDSAGAYRLVPGPNVFDPRSPYASLYIIPKGGQPAAWVEAVTDVIVLP